jgi:hypothetical protein
LFISSLHIYGFLLRAEYGNKQAFGHPYNFVLFSKLSIQWLFFLEDTKRESFFEDGALLD